MNKTVISFLLGVMFVIVSCGKKEDGGQGGGQSCSNPVSTIFPNTTGAPTLIFNYGLNSNTSGTTLNSANSSALVSYISSGGCGPFGVWESGNGGEVATEIEMRFNTRMGVFALADGVVVYIQPSTSPSETGEVEGVWVRYGANYVIKYVHVKDPIVTTGTQITAGQKIGDTVAMGVNLYFWEVEVQRKSGSSIASLAWNSLLAGDNATEFNALYGSGNCVPGGSLIGTDGSSSATATQWKNDSLTSGEWDMTDRSQPCAFP